MRTPQEIVFDLFYGRWRSQTTYVGTRLGIFERVGSVPTRADDIAVDLGLNPAMTYRLLRALAALELLQEETPRSFAATGASPFTYRLASAAMASRSGRIPSVAVYRVAPSASAFTAASRMNRGVSKSGSPAPRSMIAFPAALSALALAATASVADSLMRAMFADGRKTRDMA